jgi:hypothetical protein
MLHPSKAAVRRKLKRLARRGPRSFAPAMFATMTLQQMAYHEATKNHDDHEDDFVQKPSWSSRRFVPS